VFNVRILHLTPNYLPSLGGVEINLHEINKRLVKDGFEIEVITQREPNTPDYEVTEGIVVHRVPVFEPFRIRYRLGRMMPDMVLKMHQLNFDILHAHAYGYFPLLASVFSSKPTVITTHSDPTAKIYPFFDALRSIPIRACDRLIATTDMEKHHLIRRGAKKNRITVIPNGVTLPPLEASKKNYGKVILCLARLDIAHKGQDILLQAMPKVISKVPDAKLWIVGEGRDSAKLVKLAKELRLEVNVEFTGPVINTTKASYLRNSQVLCISPRTESFGVVYLEAMAYGLPIVTTKIGGIPEVVGDSAILVPANDPNALADALIRVLTDWRLAEDLREKSLERVKRFDWDILVEEYKKVYEQLEATT
jgi:glycosyltransferase involved in cell wall biosynthesis